MLPGIPRRDDPDELKSMTEMDWCQIAHHVDTQASTQYVVMNALLERQRGALEQIAAGGWTIGELWKPQSIATEALNSFCPDAGGIVICKTPEELLAYDQGVLDERERIIALLTTGEAPIWLCVLHLGDFCALGGKKIRAALNPK